MNQLIKPYKCYKSDWSLPASTWSDFLAVERLVHDAPRCRPALPAARWWGRRASADSDGDELRWEVTASTRSGGATANRRRAWPGQPVTPATAEGDHHVARCIFAHGSMGRPWPALTNSVAAGSVNRGAVRLNPGNCPVISGADRGLMCTTWLHLGDERQQDGSDDGVVTIGQELTDWCFCELKMLVIQLCSMSNRPRMPNAQRTGSTRDVEVIR